MGQRSQIIVRIPEYYLNENNPNNRGVSYLVYHNQWLYGMSFVVHLKDIIRNFRLIVAGYRGSRVNYTPRYFEMIDNAIMCANYQDPCNIRRTRRYFEDTEDDNAELEKFRSWKGLFRYLDNNNGFIFLDIDSEGNIRGDILNGLEDAKTIERRTPLEYVRLFYTQAQIEQNQQIKDAFVYLADCVRFDYSTLQYPKKNNPKGERETDDN